MLCLPPSLSNQYIVWSMLVQYKDIISQIRILIRRPHRKGAAKNVRIDECATKTEFKVKHQNFFDICQQFWSWKLYLWYSTWKLRAANSNFSAKNAHFHQKYPFSRMTKNDEDTKTSDCNCFGRTLELIFSAFGQATLSQMTKLLAAMILLHFWILCI